VNARGETPTQSEKMKMTSAFEELPVRQNTESGILQSIVLLRPREVGGTVALVVVEWYLTALRKWTGNKTQLRVERGAMRGPKSALTGFGEGGA